jgi:organic hydroperoxide reductase OsmC/OhrA
MKERRVKKIIIKIRNTNHNNKSNLLKKIVMSEHKVKIFWENESEDFSYKKYDRTHSWKFEGGTVVKASAAPEYLGKKEFVNPEEAFAASLASCHMLTFLAVASMKKYIIEIYEDNALAILGKNEKSRMTITKLYLRPKITFTADNIPDKTIINEMHHRAHTECFIANAVLTEIIIEPVF